METTLISVSDQGSSRFFEEFFFFFFFLVEVTWSALKF